MKNEKRFYDALEKIFVGADIEGEGGYVNLLAIKSRYYKKILSKFQEQVSRNKIVPTFQEEFFDRLYSFFEKYFSECGSVYFCKTAFSDNIYEKVYTDNKDVVLFWKTNMLYYVKSDILFQNIDVSVKSDDGTEFNFFFDCGNLQNKQNNEKRELIFTYTSTQGGKYNFSVDYSKRGTKNNIDNISRNIGVTAEILNKAFNVFKKQTTVDFFINKDAKRFLTEQLELYLHQILLAENNEFDQTRLNQLKTVKEFALKIIDFVSQFENELVKIWNKPKFVLNSNYVISLQTLKKFISKEEYDIIYKQFECALKKEDDYKFEIENNLQKIYQRPLQNLYIRNFKYIENGISFEYYNSKSMLTTDNKYENLIAYDRLYIDTKFFDSQFCQILLNALQRKNALNDIIDGQIVMSDNYHALNCLKVKLKDKVRLIYIDPPFNTDNQQFAYIDSYLNATWLSFINERTSFVDGLLKQDGSFYIHLDSNGNHLFRMLDFGLNIRREIIWNTSPSPSGFKAKANNFIRQHDNILYYTRNEKPIFNKLWRPKNSSDTPNWLDVREDEKGQYFLKYNQGKLKKEYIEPIELIAIGDVWNDVYSMMYSQNMTRENWGNGNTQKPENLLRRIIEGSTLEGDLVMDFFSGTGTTISAAHKLNRKWLCVELATYTKSIIVERMKTVLIGDFRTKLSEDINWQGGGFFKYYELEQYEDTLRKMKYNGDSSTIFDERHPFANYVFQADSKLTDVLDIQLRATDEESIVNLDFDMLYPNIDFAETISCLKGKAIRRITATGVLLEGEKEEIRTDYKNMTSTEKVEFVKMLKPLLWWGE